MTVTQRPSGAHDPFKDKMKKIETLVEDIYGLFKGDYKFDAASVRDFGTALATKLANRMSEERGKPTLRLSNLGKPCLRQLWYSINTPKLAEPLPPSTRIKFLFGDILEEFLLFLARAAGHKVEREQETVEVDGVEGHIDGVIDGELVDAKSASTYSFNKFKEHRLSEDDPFGYLTQLGAYGATVGAGRDHFLAIDKTLGNITLDSWDKKDPKEIKDRVAIVREALASDIPPPRHYSDVPFGKSGNRKLGVACSYCPFKRSCWPGLKQYEYSSGPVDLTVVVREPRVNEA